MVGNDVCGFRSTTTEDLCVRWHQIGSLLNSFYRNHNTLGAPDQHPTVFSTLAQGWGYLPESFCLNQLFII